MPVECGFGTPTELPYALARGADHLCAAVRTHLTLRRIFLTCSALKMILITSGPRRFAGRSSVLVVHLATRQKHAGQRGYRDSSGIMLPFLMAGQDRDGRVASGVVTRAGWGAVAADGRAVGAGDVAGAVGVDGEGPAELVQDHVMVPPAPVLQIGQAGRAAVGPVLDMMRSQPAAGWSQPPGNPQPWSRRATSRRRCTGISSVWPTSRGSDGPASGLPSRFRRRNEASPPGPEMIWMTRARICCSSSPSVSADAAPAVPAPALSACGWPSCGAASGRPAPRRGPGGRDGPGHTGRTSRSGLRARRGPGRR